MKKSKRVEKTNKTKKHDSYLDVLKGAAILLVVFGHSIQTFATNGNFDNNILFRIIYSFHMPLFMFLSGAAASYSSKRMDLTFIKHKFYQLVIPFVAWTIAGYYISGAHVTTSLFEVAKRTLVSPDYSLWFLWVLFLNFCILSVAQRLIGKFNMYSYLIVWLAIYILPTNKFGIGLVKWHLPFFLSGYLIYRYKDKIKHIQPSALVIALLSFPVLALTWHRLGNPSFITWFELRLQLHGLSPFAIGDLASINISQMGVLLYKYAVAFSGIGFCYWLLAHPIMKWTHKSLSFLGLFTLDIYVSHVYFFRYALQGTSPVRIISGFVVALLLSWVFGYFILRRINPLSIVFLGGRSRSKPPHLVHTAESTPINSPLPEQA